MVQSATAAAGTGAGAGAGVDVSFNSRTAVGPVLYTGCSAPIAPVSSSCGASRPPVDIALLASAESPSPVRSITAATGGAGGRGGGALGGGPIGPAEEEDEGAANS